jgi:carbamate kinase
MGRRRVVIAFGGNALIQPGQEGTQWEQLENATAMARRLVPLVRDGSELLLVHGNGPQVGNILIQVEEAVNKVPPLSLDVCVAASEGSIAYMLELALLNVLHEEGLRRPVMALVTEVVVDQKDPGFRRPTKPIGPFYPRFRAEHFMKTLGWNMVEDAGRGWRKVVPSPRPVEVVQSALLKKALGDGHLVIAAGGGGIPVYRTKEGSLKGVEAVIDKDYTAALIARLVEADVLVILTGVDNVWIDFGKPEAQPLRKLTVSEARGYLDAGQFPAGSMGPKIRAGIEFVEECGGELIITSAKRLPQAMCGRAGTRLVADRVVAAQPKRAAGGKR